MAAGAAALKGAAALLALFTYVVKVSRDLALDDQGDLQLLPSHSQPPHHHA